MAGISSKVLAGVVLSAGVLAGAGAPAVAQEFPARPVRLVVGFVPGGGADADEGATLHCGLRWMVANSCLVSSITSGPISIA